MPSYEVVSSSATEKRQKIAFHKGLLAAIASRRAQDPRAQNGPGTQGGQWLDHVLEREAAAKAHRANHQLERVADSEQMHCNKCSTTWGVCAMERDPETMFAFCRR